MIPQSILELQQYNVNLAKKLYRLGYKPLASVDSIPCYKYKNTDYDFNLCINYLEQSRSKDANLCIIADNFIVLDIDNPAEFMQLKKLAKKYNCTASQVVKTKNGYHVYYAVDYAVKAQSSINNRIAIKCNGMPITAPESYRHSKRHLYTSIYELVNTTEKKMQLLPSAMYNELRPAPKCTEAPIYTSSNPALNYNKYNLPIAEYLDRLDKNTYLFGDKIAWLRILAACKATDDPSTYSACFNWSRQGKYNKMTAGEFEAQWKSATGITNGYGYLYKLTRD